MDNGEARRGNPARRTVGRSRGGTVHAASARKSGSGVARASGPASEGAVASTGASGEGVLATSGEATIEDVAGATGGAAGARSSGNPKCDGNRARLKSDGDGRKSSTTQDVSSRFSSLPIVPRMLKRSIRESTLDRDRHAEDAPRSEKRARSFPRERCLDTARPTSRNEKSKLPGL